MCTAINILKSQGCLALKNIISFFIVFNPMNNKLGRIKDEPRVQ